MRQFVRFMGIGFLNTAVDFAVLNLFAAKFQVYEGAGVAAINTISFTAAVLHSFFWNKYWAFGKAAQDRTGATSNLGQFVTAAVLGAAIIGAVLYGAGKKYNLGYYLILLVILGVGEYAMWNLFHLKADSTSQTSHREFLLFVFISLIGVLINDGIVGGVTKVIPPQFGVTRELWTNLIKAGATGVALLWNFTGYRFFVFKSK